MNHSINIRRHSQSQAGFSLVEVTLAIGIVAFAFIGLFGLLPTGMNVFRSAIDASIGSQIVQQVTQDAQQTDYQRLISQQVNDTYYDEQGTLLTDTNGNAINNYGDPRSIYRVHVTVTTPTKIPSLSSTGGNTTANIATLTIQIAKDPSHSANPFSGNSKLPINKYVSYVARNLSAFEAQS